jgi:hypothetical protein
MELEFSRRIFENSTKFHENPSSGSHAVPRGRTDMTKQTVDFRYFANAPIISTFLSHEIFVWQNSHRQHQWFA